LDQETRDHIETELRENMLNNYGESVFVSAKTKEGVDELREKMSRLIKESYVIRYPHQAKAW
jgi:GTP-binding protein HflX